MLDLGGADPTLRKTGVRRMETTNPQMDPTSREIAPYLNQKVGFVISNDPPTSAMRRDPGSPKIIFFEIPETYYIY